MISHIPYNLSLLNKTVVLEIHYKLIAVWLEKVLKI